MTSPLSLAPLEADEVGDYGLARVRDVAFDAVCHLWRRRKAEGMTNRDLAAKTGRDPATISRNLRAPGNWTFRTFGELIQGLNGNVRIIVDAVEDSVHDTSNYDAYDDYDHDDNREVISEILSFSMDFGLKNNKQADGTAGSIARIEIING